MDLCLLNAPMTVGMSVAIGLVPFGIVFLLQCSRKGGG